MDLYFRKSVSLIMRYGRTLLKLPAGYFHLVRNPEKVNFCLAQVDSHPKGVSGSSPGVRAPSRRALYQTVIDPKNGKALYTKKILNYNTKRDDFPLSL